MKKISPKALKIISATSVTIFSLFSLVIGVYAWFASSKTTNKNADDFVVTTLGDCQLASVKLIKFDYPIDSVSGDCDYLNPEDGLVNKYDFDEDEGHFGYVDEHDNFVSVTSMNLYDPIELVIQRDQGLIDMNCNAVYEIKFTSSGFTSCAMDVVAFLRDNVETVTDNQILLSDCVNFDVYIPSDLSDNNPLFYNSTSGQYDKYYPSYKNTLTDEEKTYYKISYLSSLVDEGGHPNFYSSDPKNERIELKNQEISITPGTPYTVYINANYAPSELEKYAKELYLHNIYAIYDFGFQISLAEVTP